MTGPDERVLIEFLGWTRIDGYWYTPELLDESPKPGLQSGEPVEFPEPCKFLELVKAALRGLGVGYSTEWHTRLPDDISFEASVGWHPKVAGASEEEALARAVLYWRS